MMVNVMFSGLSLASFYFIVSAGLSLVFGVMDILNFANAGLFLAGLYAGWDSLRLGLPFGWTLLVGAAVSGLLAWGIERWLLAPLVSNPWGQLLTTLGLMLVLDDGVTWVFGPQIQQESLTGWLAGTVHLAGPPFPIYRLLLIGVGVAIWVGLSVLLHGTRFGLYLRAGVENRTLVELAGVQVRPLFSLAYALGGALAGMAGVLYGPFGGVYPTAGFDTLLLSFIVVVIGGMGSITGTLLGSLVIGLSQALVGFFLPNLALTINVLAMLVVLLVRPYG
ncbi:MAG: branched-chain amino acid ABC transporter permease, partial [Sulfobacillus sp.]|nr:branched-chain amino acid ABC transporter permease [Sulfobacillus sp.]